MNPEKYDVHAVCKRLEAALRLVERDEAILEENRKLILEFNRYALGLGLKPERRYKYLNQLRWLSKALAKPFPDASREDMIRVVGIIEKEGITEWSKVDRKVAIKRFYKWLKCNDEAYPPEVRWFRCRIKNDRCVLPEELLTEEDVKKLSDAAIMPRDRAFVQCLYECGCRISEFLTIQMKNVAFDEMGATFRVTGKTGDRRVRIVASVPALSAWVERHPYKDNPDAYLWLRRTRRSSKDPYPLGYNSSRNLLVRLAYEAGITKRVNPHLFRHSRATALANKLTEAQMKEHFGWVQGSDMAGVYVHLSGRDVDTAILEACGKKPEEKKASSPALLVCGRCQSGNVPGSKFCNNCGMNLLAEVEVERSSPKESGVLDQLLKDPDFRELMMKKIVGVGL